MTNIIGHLTIDRMMRTISVGVLLFLSLPLFAPQVALAKRPMVTPAPELSPTPISIDSYAAFWPLVAGKTIDDPLYFLKDLKQKIRGWVIFGNAQRANYYVFLGTKRVLEAEKLLRENKDDLADKTLKLGLMQFSGAVEKLEEAKTRGDRIENVVSEMGPRATNVVVFVDYLAQNQEGEVKSSLKEVKDKVTQLLSLLQ